MNAELIVSLVDPVYGPARAYCEVREGGFGVVFALEGGRRSVPAGPVYPRPRQAIRLAECLNDRIEVRPCLG